MKALATILISILMAMPAMGQKKAKKFEGTVTYSISINGMEGADEALAMLPGGMSSVYIKSRDDKFVFSVMSMMNIYCDGGNKSEMIMMMDLSMLGMGNFCIPIPLTDTTDGNEPKISKKSKKILGYKAYKVEQSDSAELWVSKEYRLPVATSNIYNYLPLEFDFENNGINLHLTAKEISFEKPTLEKVQAPKDCNYTTMEEFQVIMEEMGEGLMPEEDLDMEEDDE